MAALLVLFSDGGSDHSPKRGVLLASALCNVKAGSTNQSLGLSSSAFHMPRILFELVFWGSSKLGP